ncbi:MAG: PAS domain S-box protein, partial [Candidatus Electrothrix sp. AR3]|nr:PAS domain S-box protein [Candidatus Electrothrix sp. AR3]
MCPHSKAEAEKYIGSRGGKSLNALAHWYLFSIIVFLGAVLPIISVFFIDPSDSWEHQPLHTLISGGNAFAAISLALFIMLMQHDEETGNQYIWLAAALTGMGVLDSFHAVGIPDIMPLFFHSLSALVGGLFLALVILQNHLPSLPWLQIIPCLVAAFCFLLGTGSLLFPTELPMMRIGEQLTLTAKICSLTGSTGFILACLYFFLQVRKQTTLEKSALTCSSFLFAIAAFCFPFSSSWDALWWFWHILHLLNYSMLFFVFWKKYRGQIKSLRRDRDELKNTHNQLLDLVENSPSLVSFKDLSGRFILVNKRFEEIFGLKKRDIVGKVTTDILPCLNRRKVKNRDDQDSERKIEYEENIFFKEGTKTFMTSCFPLAGSVENASCIGCIQTDITDSRKMEYQLQLDQKIIENAKEAIVVTDAEAIIIDVNEAYTIITGYERDEVIGKNPRIAQS